MSVNTRFAFNSAYAQWRSGALWILILSLAMAIGALGSVSLLTDRMRILLEQEASAFLGADILLRSDDPIPDNFESKAKELGLDVFSSIEMPTMSFNQDQTALKLISLKAVSSGYPLRGTLLITSCATCPSVKHKGPPEKDSVFIDKALASALNIPEKGILWVGNASFKVAGFVTQEQDRQGGFSSFNPRVLMHGDDLAKTGLVQEASRARFRMGIAGEKKALALYEQWFAAQKQNAVRLENEEEERSEIDQTLERANGFLSLVAMLSALLCCAALALGGRQYAKQTSGQIALAKALGASAFECQLQGFFALLITAVVASVGGVFLAYSGQAVIVWLLGSLLPENLPTPSPLPILKTVFMCLLLLVGFTLMPIRSLSKISAQSALRKEEAVWLSKSASSLMLGLLCFLGLLVWLSGTWTLGLLTAGGFLGALLVMVLLAFFGLKALSPVARRLPLGSSLRLGMLGLTRRALSNSALSAGVATGIFALCLLTLVRTDLANSWKMSIAPDAPNRFVIEVFANAEGPLKEKLTQLGAQGVTSFPIARLRLTHINGTPIDVSKYENTRIERTVNRELNVSAVEQMGRSSSLIEGIFNAPQGVSLEQEFAEGLGVRVGDTLTFGGALGSVTAKVNSIRRVDWAKMDANFFALLSPDLIQAVTNQYLITYKAPLEEQVGLQMERTINQLSPNSIVINTEQIEQQVRAIMDKALLAIQSLFLFALFCGLLVLWSALLGTRQERIREASIARALGSSSAQLQKTQALELLFLGGCAGAIGALLAYGSSMLIGYYALEINMKPSFLWIGVFSLGGALLCWISGILALRGVVKNAALAALRASDG